MSPRLVEVILVPLDAPPPCSILIHGDVHPAYSLEDGRHVHWIVLDGRWWDGRFCRAAMATSGGGLLWLSEDR